MAKASKAAFETEVMVMMRTANFLPERAPSSFPDFLGDYFFERREPNGVRRHSIAVREKLSLAQANDLSVKFRKYVDANNRYDDIDEYWVVARNFDDGPKIVHARNQTLRIFNKPELGTILTSQSRSSEKSSKTARLSSEVRTSAGRAIAANENGIILAIVTLKLQIEEKLSVLRNQIPNDPDTIAQLNTSISDFEDMHAELERLRAAVSQFMSDVKRDKANINKEKEVERTIHTFKDSVSSWWLKNHEAIYEHAANSALFISATGLLHAMKADSGAALAIAGGLIGGKAIADVLKSLPKDLVKHSQGR